MLRRIKKIKGVGRFIDTPHIELGKLTLIYGPNCYGKSTLSDILRSIKNQNQEILSNRKSIVRNGEHIEQEIRFGVKTDTGEEKEIFCIGQRWNVTNFDYSIEVFDSRFIEDNVFTGLTIQKSNKENLTNLLIGEKSVEIGKEIDVLKRESREKAKIIGYLEDLLKRSLGALNLGIKLEKFIEIEKPDDIEGLKSKLVKLTEDAKKLEKSIAEKTKIVEMEEPNKINITDFLPLMKKIEELLLKSFSEIDNSAYSRMQEHIKQHFNNKDGYEEEWIKKGINSYLKTNQDIQHSKCPFCSQSLDPVKNLIETYQAVFSKEYETFYTDISKQLDETYQSFLQSINEIKTIDNLTNRNLATAHLWQAYFTNETQYLIKELDNLSEKVGKCFKQLAILLDGLESEIQQSIIDKDRRPFSPIEKSFVNKEISNKYDQLKIIITEYNKLVETFITEIGTLKRKSQDNQLVEELEKINTQINESNIKIKRYELASDIDKLLLLRSEKETIETKFKKLQRELEKRNEEFIKEYFQDTTRIFNKLGSVDFEIQPTYQRWGGQPVYNPTIKFANEEITNDRLPFVFSDADRRALAFSIFLARLEKKTEDELKKTIVVLDDPVTSFDDNRISETFIEIKHIVLSCRQLIIAAHHSRFLLDVYERLRNNPDLDIKFIEITRQDFGSVFKNIDDPKITLDPHAREIGKIERFIEGDSSISASDVRRALRPILQKELEWRFRKQLKGLSFKGLGELVDKLVENNSINNETARKIRDFNDVLKDDHHDTSLDIDEDTRTVARNVIEFIFEELNPTS